MNILQSSVPDVFQHAPAGSSAQVVVHIFQMVKAKQLQRFDYGFEQNMEKYGQGTPPNYDMKMVKAPVVIYWAENDALARPEVSWTLKFEYLIDVFLS